MKIDIANNEIRALVLDELAKKIKPVNAKAIKLHVHKTKPAVDILLKPTPDKKDGKGKSSVFTGKADGLPKGFDKKNIELHAEIDGKHYSFRFDSDVDDGK